MYQHPQIVAQAQQNRVNTRIWLIVLAMVALLMFMAGLLTGYEIHTPVQSHTVSLASSPTVSVDVSPFGTWEQVQYSNVAVLQLDDIGSNRVEGSSTTVECYALKYPHDFMDTPKPMNGMYDPQTKNITITNGVVFRMNDRNQLYSMILGTYDRSSASKVQRDIETLKTSVCHMAG